MNLDEHLSDYFTLRDLVRSQTAVRRGIGNTPSQPAVENLRALCVEVLEPLIEMQGSDDLFVASGYRSPELNRHVGGSIGSQHTRGEAADVEAPSMSNLALARALAASRLPFDQLILEFHVEGDPSSGWVHVSHRRGGPQRGQVLTAWRQAGAVRYSAGLPLLG